jgi:hypothetical protein
MRRAQQIGFAPFEGRENQNKVYIGSGAKLSFRATAIESNRKQILAKRFLGAQQECIEHLPDLRWELRGFQWPGDAHDGSDLLRLKKPSKAVRVWLRC